MSKKNYLVIVFLCLVACLMSFFTSCKENAVKELQGISIVSEPEQKILKPGELPNLEDLIVELRYSDGSTEKKAYNDDEFSYSFNSFDVGNNKILFVTYKGNVVQIRNYTIAKYKIGIENYPTAKEGLVYNGEEQVLLNAGSFLGEDEKYADFQYKLSTEDNSKYSINPIKVKDAGIYTIDWRVYIPESTSKRYELDSDQEEKGQITVVVLKAGIEVNAPSTSDLYYDYSNADFQDLLTPGKILIDDKISEDSENLVKVEYRVGNQAEYKEGIPQAKEIGSYSVSWKATLRNSSDKKNYYLKDGENEVDSLSGIVETKIEGSTPVEIEIPKVKGGLIYSGKEQNLISAGKIRDRYNKIRDNAGIFLYSLDNENWTEDISKIVKKDSGVYTVYWKLETEKDYMYYKSLVTKEKYISDLISGNIIVPIDQKEVTIIWNEPNFTYNENLQGPSVVVGGVCQGDTCIASVAGQKINAGKYVATVTGLNNSNYKLPSNTTKDYEIKKAGISIGVPKVESGLIYNTKAQQLIKTPGTTSAGVIQYSSDNKTWKNDYREITGTKADSYIVYWRVIDETGNYDVSSAFGQIEEVLISENSISITSPTAKTDLVYNKKAQVLVNAGTTSNTAVSSVQYSLDNKTWTTNVNDITETSAGNYTIYWKAVLNDTENYKLTGITSGAFNVNIAQKEVTLTWSNTSLTYNEKTQGPTVTVGGLISGDTCTATVTGQQINVGSYTATVSSINNANYKLPNYNSIVYRINSADITVKAPEVNIGLIYNAKAQQLIKTAGITSAGVIQYSLDNKTWTTNVNDITGTNAGTYIVYWKVVDETGNYNVSSAFGNLTVEISKVSVTVTAPTIKTGLVYNKTSQPLLNAGNTSNNDNVKIYYELKGKTGLDLKVSETIDSGVYEIVWKAVILDSNNYEFNSTAETEGSLEVSIAPKEVTLKWSDISLIYNGNSQGPKVVVEGVEEGDICNAIITGQKIDAGIYEASVSSLSNTNYKLPSNTKTTYQIDKASVSISKPVCNTNLIYTGSKQQLIKTSGSATAGVLMYSLDNKTWTENVSEIIGTNAGTYTVYWKVEGDSANYNLNNTSGSIDVVIQKSDVNVSAPIGVKNLVYTSSPLLLVDLDSMVNNSLLNIQVSLDDKNWQNVDNLAAVDVGKYTVYWKAELKDSKNYNLIGATNGTFDVDILPKEVILNWSNTSLIYNGKAQGPTVTLGEVLSGDKCAVTVTGFQTKVGTYIATASSLDNKNYKLPSKNTTSFVINKASVSITEPTVKTGMVYNRTAQVLINAGTTSNSSVSSVQYSLDNKTWKTSINDITGTNAGNYTVYWKAVLNDNANYQLTGTTEGTLNVEIAKREVSLTWSNLSFKYDGKVHVPTLVLGNVVSGDTCNAVVSEGQVNVGTYTASVISLSNSNYRLPNMKAVTYIISKVSITVKAPEVNTGLIYNTRAQQLIKTAGITSAGSMYYSLDNKTWKTDLKEIVGTNAGTYVVYWKIVENSGNYDTDLLNGVLSTVISKASITVTVPTLIEDTYSYDKSAHSVLKAGAVSNPAVSFIEYSLDSKTWEKDVNNITVTNAGNHTVYWKVVLNDTENYLVSGRNSGEFSVGVLQKEVTLTWSNTSLTYNGKAQGPTATVGGLVSGDTCTVTITGQQTNAGTYTATASALSNSNYKLPSARTTSYTINKASVTVTVPTVKSGLVYNKTAQVLINAGSFSNSGFGNIQYSFDNKTWKTNINDIKGTNAGSYTIYWKAVLSDSVNYQISGTSSGTLKVGIAQKEVTLTWSNTSLTYNGKAQGPTVTVGGLISGDTCTATITGQQTAVGTYIATASSLNNGNYKLPSVRTVSFTINKASISVTAPSVKSGLVYNRTAQVLVNAGTTGNTSVSNMQYSLDNKTWKTNVNDITSVNAGSYTVYWKVVLSDTLNYQLSGTSSGTLNAGIGQKEVTLTWSNTRLTYNGKAQGPTVTVGGLISGDTCTATITGQQTAIGTYTATASSLSNSNYKLPVVRTTSFTIINGTVTATAPTIKSGLIYNKTAQVLVNAGTTSNTSVSSIQYSLDNKTWKTNVNEITGINAGNYTVNWKTVLTDADNYKLSGITSGALSINIAQKEVTLTWGNTSLAYNGKAQGPTVTVGGLVSGDTCTATVTGQQTAIGTYTATASSLSNSNYKLPTVRTISYTINKASVVVTAPTIKSGLIYNKSAQVLANAGTTSNTAVSSIQYSLDNKTWKTNVNEITGINAGSYTIYWKTELSDVEHYQLSGTSSGTLSVGIAQKEVTLTWSNTILIYNGKSQGPSVTVGGIISGDTCTVTVTGQQVNVGTYTASVNSISNANYKLPSNKSVTYRISPIVVSSTAPEGNTGLVYNTKAQRLIKTAGTCSAGVMQYSLDNVTWTEKIEDITGINAGSYTVHWRVYESSGVFDVSSAKGNISVVISKAAFTFTAPTPKTGLIYNKSAQVLINAGSVVNSSAGSIQYSLDNISWKTSINDITGTNAGSYTVYWKAVLSDMTNYQLSGTASGTLNANIAQKEVTLTWSNTTLTYNGKVQGPTATVSNLISGDSCTVTVTGQQTNAGAYTATASTLSNGNYKLPSARTTSYIINKVSVSSTAPTAKSGLIYNKSAQVLINAGSLSNSSAGNIQYSLDNKTWKTSINDITGTNAGSYTVYWKAVLTDTTNYRLSGAVSSSVNVNIAQKEATLTWTNTSLPYNGKAQGPTATVSNLISGDICTVTVIGQQTAVGTYTATASSLSNSNYKLPGTRTVSYTIVPAEITYTAPVANSGLVYNGNAQGLIKTAGVASAGVFQYSFDNKTWKTNIGDLTAINADTYLIYWKVYDETGIYDVSKANGTLPVVVSPKEVTLKWSNTNLTYNGHEQGPIASVEGLLSGDSCTVNITGRQTNAGTYTATAESLSNPNYKLPAEKTTVYTINKYEAFASAPNGKSGLVYNETYQQLISYVGFTVGGTIEYSLDNKTWTSNDTDIQAINAGTYTVYWRVTDESGNFDVSKCNGSFDVVIAKVSVTVNVPESYGSTYDKTLQLLIYPGSAYYNSESIGTFKYSLDNKTWYEDANNDNLKRINAGSYKVYWKIEGIGSTDNFNYSAGTSGSFDAIINKKKLDYKWSNAERVDSSHSKAELPWTGEIQAPYIILTGIYDGDTCKVVTYYGTKGAKDEGTYEIAILSSDALSNSNYSLSSSDYSFYDRCSYTISKAKVRLLTEPTAKSLTYTGKAQVLINPGVVSDTALLKIQYSLDNTNWHDDVNKITATNAGSYTVYWRLILLNTDYGILGKSSGSLTASINKAKVTVTAPTAKSLTFIYDTSQVLINAGSTNSGKMQYSLNGSTWYDSVNDIKGTDVGTYRVYWRVINQSDMYDASDAKGSIEVSINKIKIYVTTFPTGKTLTYNGDGQVLINGGQVSHYYAKMEYKLDSDTTYTDSYIGGEHAGTYRINWRVILIDDSVYELSGTTSGTIVSTINKREINITAPKAISGLRYNGDTQLIFTPGELSNNLDVKNGAYFLYKFENETDEKYSETRSYVIDAGTYKLNYKVVLRNTKDCVLTGSTSGTVSSTLGKMATADYKMQESLVGGAGKIMGLSRAKVYQYSTDKNTWKDVPENSVQIGGLTAGTYYLRYKEDSNHESGYPSSSVTVTAPSTPVPESKEGIFSVSSAQSVIFSPGLLRATYHNATRSFTWDFAASQLEYIGNSSGNFNLVDSAIKNGDVVDLFGWSTEKSDFGIDLWSEDYSGNFVDWGVNVDDGKTWFTPTYEQWNYLLFDRTVNGGKGNKKSYYTAIVDGTFGLILFPDNFTGTVKDSISYTYREWLELESVGCVFLVGAGTRWISSVIDYRTTNDYWSSTARDSNNAYNIFFTTAPQVGSVDIYSERASGYAVRLVKWAN